MGVASGETVLVITDDKLREIGFALWEAACSLGAEAMLLEMIPRSRNGEEPPAPVAAIMKTVDVVLAPTSKSLSHTAARREACQAGARIATLPGITREAMVRTLCADYSSISEVSRRVADVLTSGKSARVLSPSGTDLVLSLEGRVGHPDTGMYRLPGDFGNLPAGEAYIAPVEGSAEGVIVVNGAMAGVGVLEDHITMRVEHGYVTEISGGQGAKALEEAIAHLGKPARNIAELGVGTNDRAVVTGKVLEDEKVLGTVHIAIGNNVSFGGTVDVPSHLDGIILQPTLLVDGVAVIEDGVLKV
ncbi:MAG: aminopeptidase [Firmicutes bacterium]|jgi:leucyl aminopeptidase (aminopeptidase T)|nr:aminopeptidase [Bacillota bacterium]MDH7494611.1 aminopeptidase [Bacillota bacterium]